MENMHEPAFPIPEGRVGLYTAGLTKREWLIGQALPAIILDWMQTHEWKSGDAVEIANRAADAADAVLGLPDYRTLCRRALGVMKDSRDPNELEAVIRDLRDALK